MDIKKAKEAIGMRTSEELFNIPPQVPPQCPQINELVFSLLEQAGEVKSAYNELQGVEESVASSLDWVEHRLRSLESEIEELRSNFEGMRSWGEGWKDLAKDLLEENEGEKIKSYG